VITFLLVGMMLMGTLLLAVTVRWMRGLVRLDQELRWRAHHAALLQTYDIADGAPDRRAWE